MQCMKNYLLICLALGGWLAAMGCDRAKLESSPHAQAALPGVPTNSPAWDAKEMVVKTDAEWRAWLTPSQYAVLRKHDTEPSFTGAFWNHHDHGVYVCAGCGLPLFSSEAKFESGTGWPSYYQPVKAENVGKTEDNSLFARRVEVHCARCGGHLGHVFEDGPQPTGLRYCINSAALAFEAKK